jgi:plastocyanin
MKKFILLTALLLGGVAATFAADHKVTVSDFQFTPAVVNARVGDTISWSWQTGSMAHTTTSVTIPSGAAPWNSPMDATTPRFRYRITTAGTYRYQCNIHASIMKGTIKVR